MENIALLKIEIIITIISFFYMVYYYFERMYFKNLKPRLQKLLKNELIVEEIKKENIVPEIKDNFYKKINLTKYKASKEDKEKLEDIIKRVKINSSKWYLDTSKSLIIEWLAIDKNNRELNIELANIYKKEKKYKNAEYIYFDLIETKWDNFEILKNLGYILALQKQFKKSIKIYEKALQKKNSDIEVLEMLTDLNYEIENFKLALKYAKLYLKYKPKDFNKLLIEWICYENTWKVMDAIISYKNMLEIQPYNTEVIERLKNLED